MKVRQLLLSTIKADLQKRIIAAFPRPENEPAQALNIGDTSEFERELLNELKENVQPKSLPCRRTQRVADVRSAEPVVTDEESDAPHGMDEIESFEDETLEDETLEDETVEEEDETVQEEEE